MYGIIDSIQEVEYEDGEETIFLYTKGKLGNISSELQELLDYMGDTRAENAKNDTLQKIQEMVNRVKGDLEVAKRVMRIDEKIRDAREEGRAEERVNTERERKRAEAVRPDSTRRWRSLPIMRRKQKIKVKNK